MVIPGSWTPIHQLITHTISIRWVLGSSWSSIVPTKNRPSGSWPTIRYKRHCIRYVLWPFTLRVSDMLSCKVVLTSESVDKLLWCYHSTETSSAVLSHGTIYLVCSSNFESVDKILWCYHSNETSSAVLSNGTIYLVCSSNFWVRGCNRMVYPFKLILSSFAFTWWESPYGVNVWKWALFVLFCCENRSPLPSTSDYD